MRFVLFAPEGYDAVAAVAAGNQDFGFVNKFHDGLPDGDWCGNLALHRIGALISTAIYGYKLKSPIAGIGLWALCRERSRIRLLALR